MNWTLLVPGTLLAPRLAPELTRAIRAPRLARQLALAGSIPAAVDADAARDPIASAATQSAHWAWLGRRFGLDAEALVTAPYAWRAGSGASNAADGGAPDDGLWIARCDPVHMAIARDHFVVTDLAEAPLLPHEAGELLDLANAVLATEAAGPMAVANVAPPLRLAERNGQWFLLSPKPLDLTTWSLDAVLGQSVQDRLPVGADARRWRVLANEIQMSWHASASTAARDEAATRTANALWLHGGGVWQALGPVTMQHLRVSGAQCEAATLRGWLQAAGPIARAVSAPEPAGGADTLAICRDLFGAYAHQAWESWVDQWAKLDARIDEEMQAARQNRASRFDLVLCGVVASRTIALPLGDSWWRRLRSHAHAPPVLLQRWLTEVPPKANLAAGPTRHRSATPAVAA